MHNATRFPEVSIRTPVKGVIWSGIGAQIPLASFNPHPREGGDPAMTTR